MTQHFSKFNGGTEPSGGPIPTYSVVLGWALDLISNISNKPSGNAGGPRTILLSHPAVMNVSASQAFSVPLWVLSGGGRGGGGYEEGFTGSWAWGFLTSSYWEIILRSGYTALFGFSPSCESPRFLTCSPFSILTVSSLSSVCLGSRVSCFSLITSEVDHHFITYGPSESPLLWIASYTLGTF